MSRQFKTFIAGVFVLSTALIASPTSAIASVRAPQHHEAISTLAGYPVGECTYWVSNRRDAIGRPIPQTWGNAYTWDDFARASGYTVNHTPRAGAIMQSDAGAFGHVAFVEIVYADGGWQVSEMNWIGWNVVSNRTFSSAQAASYDFIH